MLAYTPGMRNITRSFAASVVGLVLALLGRADAPSEPARQVLLLDNGSTFVGQVTQEGKSYRVRTQSGETTLPAARVLRICESLESAHDFLRARANLRDPHERIRLARWCQQQQLFEQARIECDAALELNPRNVEAQRLAKTLAMTQPAPTSSRSTRVDEPIASNPQTEARTVSEHSYALETLQSFTRKVQPILFNTCGTGACHGGQAKTGFDLQRSFGNAGAPASMTRNNLLQALSVIDKNDPVNSLLLKKAVEAHGGAQRPPFAGRDAIAFQALEKWVVAAAGGWAAEHADSSRDVFAKKSADKSASSFASGKPVSEPGDKGDKNDRGDKEAVPRTAAPPTVPLLNPRTAAATPDKPAPTPPRQPTPPPFQGGEVVSGPREKPKPDAGQPSEATHKLGEKLLDPFDPAEFNRRAHPGKEK
jgi:hypothetical protein